jgi:hypothetical protein
MGSALFQERNAMPSSTKNPPDPTNKGILSQYVIALFWGDRYLYNFDLRLQAAGILKLSDLVSVPRQELFRRFPTTEANKRRVRTRLKNVGLKLHA